VTTKGSITGKGLQFARRLRAIIGELDANRVRLDRAVEETDKRLVRSDSGPPSSGRNNAR
jgi:hypothetical protein